MEYAEQGNGAGHDFKTERDESPFGKGSVGREITQKLSDNINSNKKKKKARG